MNGLLNQKDGQLLRGLSRLFGDQARFLGVLHGDAKVGKIWQQVAQTPYPVLLDPKLELISRFGVERSAYVALIRSDGTVARLWPGYSKEMLQELNTETAKLAKVPAPKFDSAYAPTEMTSGCRFDSDDNDA